VLRIFFRRIEVAGLERVPRTGPVIFVLNHPNGLIDPAFLLCLAPRRVSFLGKAPLFRMPVIRWFARAFEAIPVYRRQEGEADPAKTRETFEAARAVLRRGGTIGIFPEGTSHSDPKLRPLKTGAARIALGAAALGTETVRIVPAGLYYRAKRTFRSVALLYFGEPFVVTPVPLAKGDEPPPDATRALTAQIERALAELTLQAEHDEALALVERAERIFSAAGNAEPGTDLAQELELRRRFLEGYHALRTRWPDRFERLRGRIARYEAATAAAGLDVRHPAPRHFAPRVVARFLWRSLAVAFVLLPLAIVGTVVHYPAYRIVGYVATGIAKGKEDSLATVKVLAAMLLFPLTWLAVALPVAAIWGPWPGLFTLALLPPAGYAALLVLERLDRLFGAARALALFTLRRRAFLRLAVERRGIREEIVELGRALDLLPTST